MLRERMGNLGNTQEYVNSIPHKIQSSPSVGIAVHSTYAYSTYQMEALGIGVHVAYTELHYACS